MRHPQLFLITILTTVLPLTALAATSLEQEVADLKKRLERAESRIEANKTENTGDGKGNTDIAAYAEIHYNNLNNKLTGASDKKELDVHRAVIEFEHHFASDVRAEIEIEIEHAFIEDSNGSKGELEVEQAFVEFKYDHSLLKLGQFILPVGIMNKKHRPTDFYGVERNSVENKIIPTTWWETGVLYHHKIDKNLSLDGAITSGLNTTGQNNVNYAVRNGRQKGSEAQADDLAFLITVKWSPMPGLNIGASLQHQADITQGNDVSAGSANLLTAHAIWTSNKITVQALYATWDLDGSGPASVGADEQTGWYIEPSYRINEQYGVFARYSTWDNQAGDATDSEYSQVDFGMNYWPLKNVVIKVDYQDQDTPNGTNEFDGFNLGVGFTF